MSHDLRPNSLIKPSYGVMHSGLCSQAAQAHVVQYHRATWTSCINLFSSSISWEGSLSENKPFFRRHVLQLNLLNFCLFLYSSLSSFSVSHVTSDSTFPALSSVPLTLFWRIHPADSSRCSSFRSDLLLAWGWASGWAKPGQACLVTALRAFW